MKLGFLLGYSGKQIHIPMELIHQAESMGFDSVWTAEAYGNDAVSTATWILAQTKKIRVGTAIMQMPARSPAMCAMTSMSLHQLSGGRFISGLGASGPQVVEGWHGVPYGKPVTRTREYIQIMRKIMERDGPVEFDGQVYQLPIRGLALLDSVNP
jgi:alkanesulfonate monooxygenase SsuD/methylene tetrahydromethanopterin reductase-like flavin-dependent oxidoreductase (luciferase family)